MNIVLWLVLGALAGWISSVIMKTDAKQGMLTDIMLGIVGGFVGGLKMSLFGQPGVSGLNLYSLIVAIIGASVLIYLGRAAKRGMT